MIRRCLNTLAICQASHGHIIEAIADALNAYRHLVDAHDLRETMHALTTLVSANGFIFDTLDRSSLLLDWCLPGQADLFQNAHTNIGTNAFGQVVCEVHCARPRRTVTRHTLSGKIGWSAD